MEHRYITALVAASLAIVPAFGQDLNPTVNVTNTYQGKLMEVSKKQLPMEVPDSVLKFDYLFDYSVNNNPYKGVSEFNPYSMNLNPQATVAKVNHFFFRAGAGYLLNPEMDVVWSPYAGKRFSFSLYDHLDGFFGRTKNLVMDHEKNWVVKDGMQQDPTLDLYNKIGGTARLDFDKSLLKFDVGYGLLATKDTIANRQYHTADASVEFKSKDIDNSYFLYDVTGKYTYGFDRCNQYSAYLAENIFGLNADLGYVFDETHRAIADVGYDMATYNGCYAFTNSIATFGAKYQARFEKAVISAGLKAATNPTAQVAEGQFNQMTGKGFRVPIYPDVYASYALFHDALTIYALADGGRYMNTYNSMVSNNHHISQLTACSFDNGHYDLLMDNTDVIRVAAGLRGKLIEALNYEFKFGCDFYGNALLDAINYNEIIDLTRYTIFYTSPLYCVNYGDYKLGHFDFAASWKSKHVDIDGTFTYQTSDISKQQLQALTPSMFKANVQAVYHWADRIHAGVMADYASSRTQSFNGEYTSFTIVIPSYVDLSIYADYSYSSKLTFWIKGGNLLNQTIQRSPMYAESGINCTAGISIKI